MSKQSPGADWPDDLIDPRGVPAEAPVKLALRPVTLDGCRLLLLDNGKLGAGLGPNAALPDALCDGIQEAVWARATVELLKVNETEIGGIAENLMAAHQPEACVLALADAGVTANTALLAVALERRGVPSVVLATPLGAGLGRAIFREQAPGMEVVTLETVRSDSADRMRALVAEALPRLRVALSDGSARTVAAAAAPRPAPGGLRSLTRAAADMAAFQDWAAERGLGDGLPLIPPTAAAVAAHLATVDVDPDALLYGPALTSGRLLRVRDAAANAVMTGCPPRAFPVVVAALRAMAMPGYRLSQAAITTHPSGNAVILAGVDPEAYGMSAGAGCLGPGHRGNACVGRAVSLSVLHLFGARPGEADLTIFGSPVEFTYGMAEATDGNPWPSLAAELGDGAPGVLVMKAEAPRNILETMAVTPQGLCEALAGAAVSPGANNSFLPGELLVFLNPEHAAVFASAGWTRRDVADAIHGLARIPRQRVAGRGVVPDRPRYMDALECLPVTRSAADVRIVVAGGRGPQSMVALPWGYSRAQWQAL